MIRILIFSLERSDLPEQGGGHWGKHGEETLRRIANMRKVSQKGNRDHGVRWNYFQNLSNCVSLYVMPVSVCVDTAVRIISLGQLEISPGA